MKASMPLAGRIVTASDPICNTEPSIDSIDKYKPRLLTWIVWEYFLDE